MNITDLTPSMRVRTTCDLGTIPRGAEGTVAHLYSSALGEFAVAVRLDDHEPRSLSLWRASELEPITEIASVPAADSGPVLQDDAAEWEHGRPVSQRFALTAAVVARRRDGDQCRCCGRPVSWRTRRGVSAGAVVETTLVVAPHVVACMGCVSFFAPAAPSPLLSAPRTPEYGPETTAFLERSASLLSDARQADVIEWDHRTRHCHGCTCEVSPPATHRPRRAPGRPAASAAPASGAAS